MRNAVTLGTVLILFLLPLPGCGGGGAAPTDEAAQANEPPAPPPETPIDTALDQQLAPLLAQANAAPLPPARAHAPALIGLGQALFFDKILSGNRNISCASCHQPTVGTGDGLSVSIGQGGIGQAPGRALGTGALIARNAPPLFHLGQHRFMFWDGRVELPPGGNLRTPEPSLNGPNPPAAALAAALPSALSAQALFPPTSRDEMRGQAGENEIADAADNPEVWRRLMARLVGTGNGTVGGIAVYRQLFQAAYPAVTRFDDFNFAHAGAAIAAFLESALDTRDSPYDAYLGGDHLALPDEARRGAILFFGRAGCVRCHGGPDLTDGRFHAIGVPQVGPGRDAPLEDLGRISVTNNPGDRYAFKTPGLRNVALVGPWMHDGAYTTLAGAVAHYRNPAASLANYDASQLAPLLQELVDVDPVRQAARSLAISNLVRGGVRLNANELSDLVRFLESLTEPATASLGDIVPISVPSGLAVGD